MNQEIKAKWVEALRSGEYRQCQGALHTGIGFCCLGVLADILGEEWALARGDSQYKLANFEEENEALPVGFRGKIGLLDKDQSTLIWMNDGKPELSMSPASFLEIADFIEKNL